MLSTAINRSCLARQHSLHRFHVDDLMASHVDKKVNDRFLKWSNHMHGGCGAVTATRGHKHDFLGMTFDFSEPGKVIVDMVDHMEAMVDDFSVDFKSTETSAHPVDEELFKVGDSPALESDKAQEFHTFVAKGLFACKRARPDIGSWVFNSRKVGSGC